MKMKNLILVSVICVVLAGCSGRHGFFGGSGRGLSSAVKYSKLKPNEPAQEIPVQIKRTRLVEVLKDQDLNRARLVEVFPREGSPAYRLFDVQPGSVYIMLGLSGSDTILAADDYVINDGRQFLEFISVLPNESRASIRIKRGGQTMLLNIQLID